jgi:hypothetical protein
MLPEPESLKLPFRRIDGSPETLPSLEKRGVIGMYGPPPRRPTARSEDPCLSSAIWNVRGAVAHDDLRVGGAPVRSLAPCHPSQTLSARPRLSQKNHGRSPGIFQPGLVQSLVS